MFKKLLVPVLILSGLSFTNARPSYQQPSVKGDADNAEFFYGTEGKKKSYKESKEYLDAMIRRQKDPKAFERESPIKTERSKTVKPGKKKNQF